MTAVFTDAAMTRIEEAARTMLLASSEGDTLRTNLADSQALDASESRSTRSKLDGASRSDCWRRNDTSSCSGLVGLPGSGKSTWARKQGVAVLSSDELRLLLADDESNQTIHREVFATLRLSASTPPRTRAPADIHRCDQYHSEGAPPIHKYFPPLRL